MRVDSPSSLHGWGWVDSVAHKSLEAAAQRLAAIVESSDDAILSTDLDGVIDSWNRGAERLFGYRADEAIGRSVALLRPPGRADEEPDILERIKRGERVEHHEGVRRRKDGTLVDVSLSASPIKNGQGRVVGAAKILRDIAERRRIQHQQKLLLREMTHRVKNLFAVAGSLVTLSARGAATPAALSSAVRTRLNALARAHELTLTDPAETGDMPARVATLAGLVRTMVSPFVDAEAKDGERVAIAGPEVVVGSAAVTHVALVLNELATNAAKYGALSIPAGRLAVTWAIDGDKVRIRWEERGGPPVAAGGGSEGFGTLLVRVTVSSQLDGEISRSWQPEGMVVEMAIHLERLKA